jgi:hypothetical protein
MSLCAAILIKLVQILLPILSRELTRFGRKAPVFYPPKTQEEIQILV